MSNNVWSLSVDLSTKTAVFTTGLSDAAKAARGSFQEIKSGAREMGRATSGSMMEARHGVMLLGEEFGIRLPRALTTFIASIGPVGAAMEAAFPFLAIIVGATLLLEHLSKLKEAGQQLTNSQLNFGTTVANVLNGLNDKLLQAGIRADELRGDHLAALNKELQAIDHQSMDDLVRAFDAISKASDKTFADLKTSWYQWSAGSAGAKNALEAFKAQYESLLAQGKNKEANDLLAGTRQSAEHVLELQKQIRDNQTTTGTHGTHQGDYTKFEQAANELKRQGIGYTDQEVKAQQTLVDALRAQVAAQETVNATAQVEKGNKRQTEQNKVDTEGDSAARLQAQTQRQAADEAQKMWEENYRRAVEGLQENERQKIDATREGSAARLAAIDSAIKEEESKGLQETGFYRGLLTSRVELTRQMAEEQSKLTAEAGKIDAEHGQKMGELQVQADKEAAQLRLSARRVTDQERVASDTQIANEEYQVQLAANAKEIDALDKGAKDYENKLKALQDKQLELVREHENQVTAIKEKAEEDRNRRILAAQEAAENAEARSLSRALMGQKSFAVEMRSLASQVASGLMENALKAMIADDMTKPHDAAAAARKAYLAGMQFPFPANLVIGPALGAMAFASVMAFETGGLVPGVGNRDSVPAMLTPGEAVLPKRLTENLTHAARSGSSGQEIHVHNHFSPQIHAVDAEGVDRMLEKHGEKFNEHAANHIRKMNH
jgi:hypothetical protein